MTCLIARVLGEARMKSHTSMLRTFFVYSLALCMLIFKKKSSRRFMEKTPQLFIVVTLLQWKVWQFFPEISAKIFSWKSAYIVPRNIQKCPQHKSMWLHPAQNFGFQASYCSTLLIGCLNFLGRLYIYFLKITAMCYLKKCLYFHQELALSHLKSEIIYTDGIWIEM